MSRRVLLIDDEVVMHRLVSRVLADCEVTVQDDARKALELIATGAQFEVVLCDLRMRNMNGMEFFQALQAARPALAERVLFITGGATEPAAQRFVDEHPGLILHKPVEVARLRAAVAALMAS
jgi:CheY-like chemotaxis protein